jgi:hypothetical protein
MKTLLSLNKANYTPKSYKDSSSYLPYVIAWKGELFYTTREEAVSLIRNKMIFSCYGVGDFTPEERLKVKIEAMQWHFDEIGAPIIVRKAKCRTRTWMITCPVWNCSYPTRNPLLEMKKLFDEITSCIDPKTGNIETP